ncbi:MAG TPA: hypothetical protein VN999_04420 [Thermoanaerobaculia bacterium]|nr:hypothetical protein [Thermoanaerobaculia bacterium]
MRELFSNAVAGDAKGIGVIGMPYILSAKTLKVSAKGSVPRRPTVLTVYLLSRRLYLDAPLVVEGFGAELPVAGNATEEAREKNRRVEIWLRR